MDQKLTKLVKPTRAEAREGYRIWIKFDDGVQGMIDLNGFVGRGVWKAWEDRTFFESVGITPYRAIGWGESDDLDMCADWAYRLITGRQDCIPGSDTGVGLHTSRSRRQPDQPPSDRCISESVALARRFSKATYNSSIVPLPLKLLQVSQSNCRLSNS